MKQGESSNLAVVFGKGERRDAFAVSLLEPSQALTGGDLPDPNLTSLRSGGQHLAVPGEGQTQDGLLHHHEIILSLVPQVLPDLAGGEVPDLEESVDRAGDQVLSVGRKRGALDVRLGPELDLLAQRRRVLLLLLLSHGGLAPEQVDLGAWRQKTLVLLPLESLAEQGQQPGRRHHGDLARERLREVSPAPFFGLPFGIGLSGVEVAPGQQVFQVDVSLGLVLLHQDHGVGLAEERPRGSELTKLDKLNDDLEKN